MAKLKEVTRINLNLANDLLKKVDEYAENLTVNRTVAITVLLNSALTTDKALGDMNELIKFINNNQALMVKGGK